MVRRRLSDADLVRAAQGGDRDALEEVLRANHDRMFVVCLRMLNDRAAAEDCTQEALLRVVRGLAAFDHRSAVSTWCHRIAVTTALDELRRRRRRPATVADSAGDGSDGSLIDRLEDPAAAESVTAPVERAEVRDEIGAALRSIPEEFARAVILRDVADLDYAEIAEELGVAVGTVKSRISRGRSLLHGLLTADGNRDDRPGRQTAGSPADGGSAPSTPAP
jgi:RNA polymerase sigma-70 factor (ECF subfamily)